MGRAQSERASVLIGKRQLFGIAQSNQPPIGTAQSICVMALMGNHQPQIKRVSGIPGSRTSNGSEEKKVLLSREHLQGHS